MEDAEIVDPENVTSEEIIVEEIPADNGIPIDEISVDKLSRSEVATLLKSFLHKNNKFSYLEGRGIVQNHGMVQVEGSTSADVGLYEVKSLLTYTDCNFDNLEGMPKRAPTVYFTNCTTKSYRGLGDLEGEVSLYGITGPPSTHYLRGDQATRKSFTDLVTLDPHESRLTSYSLRSHLREVYHEITVPDSAYTRNFSDVNVNALRRVVWYHYLLDSHPKDLLELVSSLDTPEQEEISLYLTVTMGKGFGANDLIAYLKAKSIMI
jgi:hypothetical protein